MPDLHTFVNQMNGGEMSPQMDGRVDIEKYQTGARVLENFIVRPYGGIYKRPGTDFISQTYNNKPAVLLPFENPDKSYVLEFTPALNTESNGYLRIWDATTIWDGASYPSNVVQFNLVTDVTHPTKNTTNYYNTWASLSSNISGQTKYLTGGWDVGTNFTSGQGIFYNNKLFIASVDHTATIPTAPLSGDEWSDYWNQFNYKKNDLVYWDNSGGSYYGFKALDNSYTFLSSVSLMRAATATWQEITPFPDIVFETPYYNYYQNESNLRNIQICAINNVVFIAHPDHAPRKLTRKSDTNWTFEEIEWDFAPTLDVNDTTNILQLQFNEPYWLHNISYKIGDRVTVLDSVSSTNIYTCHTTHVSNSANNATGIPGRVTNWRNYWNYGTSSMKYRKWATATGYKGGDKVWYANTIYECVRSHTSITSTTKKGGEVNGDNEPTKGKAWTSYWKIADSSNAAKDVNYVLTSSENTFTNANIGETWQVNVAADDYYLKIVLPGAANTSIVTADTDIIFLQGSYLVLSNWTVNNAPRGTYALEESLDGQTWYIVQQWLVDAVSDSNINFTGEAPSTGAWYRFTGFRNEASTGSFRLTLEPLDFTLKLPFKIKSIVDGKTVKGIIKTFNSQLVPSQVIGKATANYRKPAFSASSGYPTSVTFHENRLWWGGVKTQPGRIWGSQKDDYYIYLLGTKATDALDVTLQSVNTSKILWLKSYNRAIVAATAFEIFTVDAGDTDSQISSTNIRARSRTAIGATEIPGFVTADSLLYVQNGRKRLREFSYNFSRDAWDVPDITIYAEHINQQGFVDAGYMNSPEPVLWCIGRNGALMGLSYDRNQNIIAWHRHITGDRDAFYGVPGSDPKKKAEFLSVTCVNGEPNKPDDIWFVIRRRDLNGNDYYCIERFNISMMNLIFGNPEYVFDDEEWRYIDCSMGLNRRVELTAENKTVYYNENNTGLNTVTYKDIPYPGDKLYYVTKIPLSSGSIGTNGVQLSAGTGLVFNTIVPNFNMEIGSIRPIIGIPVNSVYIPTRFEMQLQNGTSQGRKLRINRIAFRLWKSDGGKFNVYDSFQQTVNKAATALEIKPSPNDNYTFINYDRFNYNIMVGLQDTMEYFYTGQTDDQVVNMNWTENPLLAIVHNENRPFNITGLVYKMEVQGN